MSKILWVLALVVGCAAPSFAFDRAMAIRKSQGLLDEQVAQSWDLFRQGHEAARRGDTLGGAFLVRSGLEMNPAEAQMHMLAAALFEQAGANEYARAHWDAAGSLLPQGSKDERRANAAMQRIKLPKNAPAAAGTSGPAPAGLDYLRVQGYAGRAKAVHEVATVFAMDAAPRWGTTYICKINDVSLPRDAMASVVYLLPGNYNLGWCYGRDGREAQGVQQVRVQASKLYQVNVSIRNPGNYSPMFMEMPSNRLTWRNIAPGKSSLPEIDGLVPYGPS